MNLITPALAASIFAKEVEKLQQSRNPETIADLRLKVSRAQAALTTREGLVMMLVEGRGQSIRSVAAATRKRPSTVRKTYDDACAKLAEHYEARA